MVAGIVAGLSLTFVAPKLLATVSYGVTASNPNLLGVAVLLLVLTGIAAAWIPANRAAAIQPLDALRQD